MTRIDPSRSAVVLASSFLGVYAHAGFLNRLDQSGLRPVRLAGASAGALAGALYASGLQGDALRDAALDRALRRSFLDVGFVWRLPGVLTGIGASGLFSGRGTIAHLRRTLGDSDLADLSRSLDIAVTDASTSVTEIRRSGPLAELVMASCAVPVLFTIQEIAGTHYLDGGISGELPFEHLIEDASIDTLILHRIVHETGTVPLIRSRTSVGALALVRHAASADLHRLRVERARDRGKHVVEIETVTPFPGLFGHKLAPVCYQRGFESGGRVLAEA